MRKVNGQWRLQWRDAQGRVRRKMLGRDQRTAERIRADIIRQRDLELAGLGIEGGQELPLAELIASYLDDLAPRASALHLKNLRQRYARILADLGDLRVRELNVALVTRLRAQALAGGAANRTANLITDSLHAALEWALAAELIGKNPIARLKRLPESRDHQRCRRRAMTEEEIARFLEAAHEDDLRCVSLAAHEGWTRVPQVPLWRACLETGARWGELRMATWGDLDLGAGDPERGHGSLLLRAETTKSKRTRVVPVTAELAAVLHELRAIHAQVLGRLPSATDRVFLSPEGAPWRQPTTNPLRIFYRVLVTAGIERMDAYGEKLDLHALRTTANTRLARLGVELSTRQALLGHADPRTTANVYTRLATQDLARAVAKLPALGSAADGTRDGHHDHVPLARAEGDR